MFISISFFVCLLSFGSAVYISAVKMSLVQEWKCDWFRSGKVSG
jgi:hypothetical protein